MRASKELYENTASVLYPSDLQFENREAFMRNITQSYQGIELIVHDRSWPRSRQLQYICQKNSTC